MSFEVCNQGQVIWSMTSTNKVNYNGSLQICNQALNNSTSCFPGSGDWTNTQPSKRPDHDLSIRDPLLLINLIKHTDDHSPSWQSSK